MFWLLRSTNTDKVLQEMTVAKNWPVFNQECKGKENPKLWVLNRIGRGNCVIKLLNNKGQSDLGFVAKGTSRYGSPISC